MSIRGALAIGIALLCWGTAAAGASTPEQLVRRIYRGFAMQGAGDYVPSDSFYSARLKRLIAAALTAAGGEEPCGLDFVVWGDAQEDRITDARVTRLPDPAPRVALVGATFRNLGQPHSLRFTFRRERSRWVLDDARSLTGTRWVWSRMLRCES